MIPFSRHQLNSGDIRSVVKVLRSDFLTTGKQVPIFEKKLTKITKAKFAFACNSGSSALHLACLALGLKKGDIVWTAPNTYAASANCVLNCGAKIDFVDIDNETWNISLEKLKKKLILAKKKKKLPKVIIPIHFAGQPSNQIEIKKLSRKYNFKIIEDASHSIGAKHFNEPVGSCKWSDLTVFSFHPVKIITTGEGGAVLTNNVSYATRIKIFRENGITNNRKLFRQKSYYPTYYEQVDTGYNYRMSDISAALGISQLKSLKKFIKYRNKIAKTYQDLLKGSSFLKFQKILPKNRSSFHLFVIQFNPIHLKIPYGKVFNYFKKKGYFVNLHYKALHLNPFYKNLGFKKGQFPVSEKYSERSLSLPIFVGLKNKEVIKIVKILKGLVDFKK